MILQVMQIKKAFIASSTKMNTIRIQLENAIVRKSKLWESKGFKLEVENCEHLSNQVVIGGSQKQIDKQLIEQCDIFILLVEDTLGKHTEDEFYLAESLLHAHESILMLTYFQKLETDSSDTAVIKLKQHLKVRNHYYRYYNDYDQLWNLINFELDKYENNGFQNNQRKPNALLEKCIVELHADIDVIKKQLLEFENSGVDWRQDRRNKTKFFDKICGVYGGIIGTNLQKLYRIGNSENAYSNQLKIDYTQKSIQIAQSILDILVFGYLSQLWDVKIKLQLEIPEALRKSVANKIVYERELGFVEQYNLLKTLHEYFNTTCQNYYPFEELLKKSDFFSSDKQLHETCKQYDTLVENLEDKEYAKFSIFTAEILIVQILALFDFLVRYKMISIKRVYYKETRNSNPHYLYRLLNLGLPDSSESQTDIAFVSNTPITTDSVLLYKGDTYDKHLNLTPFIIDLNSISYETGIGICILKAKDSNNNDLLYTHIQKEKEERIKQSYVSIDPNDKRYISDNDIKTKLNLKVLHQLYSDAVKCLTQ